MPRRGSTSQWNSRLSAGGANRTNIHGQMSRVSDPDIYAPYQQNSSDLLQAPRRSSFQPWNSRLFAQPRSPQPPTRHWEPHSSQHHQAAEIWEPPRRDRSPDILFDEKGRPVPRKGMFLNAKYSETVRPIPDEQQIRRTEAMIQRIVHPRARGRRPNYMPDFGLRDRIRQVVYDMGVPQDYRLHEQSSHHNHDPNVVYHESMPHTSNQIYQQNDNARRKLSTRRRREESSGEEEVEENDRLRKAPYRKNRHNEEETAFPDPPRQGKTNKAPGPVDNQLTVAGQEKQKRRFIEPEEEKSDEESSVPSRNSLNASRRSGTKSNDDHNSSRGSRTSAVCTPKLLTPSPQYVRDPDDDDNWKNSISFMSKPNSVGSDIFARIGSAIPSIPLKDNTQNSYSKVALMLLDQSIKNSKSNTRPTEKREKIQTQLMNMSTSWVRTMNGHRDEEDERHGDVANKGDSEKTLMNEISRIQNPQNVTKVQINDSLFTNSKLFRPPVFDATIRTKNPKCMPPPRFQSSPISRDVVRSDEGITMPSSIPKTSALMQNDSEEEEEPSTRAHDVDDYIARGASQLNFSRTLESLSSSFRRPDPGISSSFQKRPTAPREMPSSSSKSKKTNDDIVEETQRSTSRITQKELEEHSSKSHFSIPATSSTLQMNSQFQLSAKKKRKTERDSVLDFDAETQKMFEEVFTNEKVRGDEESVERRRNREKYSF